MVLQTPSFVEFVILALAVWRLATLFANEDGPFDVLAKIRGIVGVQSKSGGRHGTNVVAKALICVWCSSVWFAFGLCVLFYAFPQTIALFLLFALSAVAAILEETSNRLMGY